jgi:Flp pilus assembly protein TadD/ribosomal protein S27AE
MRMATRLLTCLRLSVMAGLFGGPALGQQTQTFVAYSMKVAQSHVEQATRAGEDFRKSQPDVFCLGGMTKPLAVVIDREGRDTILLGEANPDREALTLDDWVAALRARFRYPEEDPGVTIDPRPCERCDPGSVLCNHTNQQDVRFFAGVSNTHFGQICFDADWLMKEFTFERKKPPVAGLEGYLERCGQEYQRIRANHICARFWLEPVGMPRVFPDVVMLEPIHIAVFTEVLHAEVDGKVIADPSSYHFAPHEAFADWLTSKYTDIARSCTELRTLLGLTELAALAKGLTRVDEVAFLDFFLTRYPNESVKTPSNVELVRLYDNRWHIQHSGGATLMALAVRVRKGDARALIKMVLTARELAGPDKMVWEVKLVTHEGRLAGVSVSPDYSVDPKEIAPWLARAAFLLRKGDYDAAVDYYTKILERVPDDVETLTNRGVAYRLKGRLDAAESDYRRAISIDPRCGRTCNNLGVLLMRKGRRDEAEELFRKGIQMAPSLPPIHNNLAICLRHKGELKGAAREYQAAIAMNRKDPDPCHNLGLCLLLDGKVQEAADALCQAVKLRPESGESRFWYGVALFEDGKNDLARETFQRYLKLGEHPTQNNQPCFASYRFATVASSFLSDDAAVKELGVDMKPATARQYLRLIEAQRR